MKIRFDFSHLMSSALGPEEGITAEELKALAPEAEKVQSCFKEARSRGEIPFADLPYQGDQLPFIKGLAEKVRGRCDDFVHLGIGGSSLGPKALHQALNHPWHNALPRERRAGAPRAYFVENIDATTMAGLKEVVEPAGAFFNVVSKSGATVETLAQFLYFRHWLREELGDPAYLQHLAMTTDPARGALRKIAERDGISCLDVPAGVEGRYSVLSPVGLFPAAVLGIDIDQLLQGAAFMDSLLSSASLEEDPAFMMATLLYLEARLKGKGQLVVMPYGDGLYALGQWFRQLWAESLGKNGQGTTPVLALGTVDQHSQFQLYIAGPKDKVILFIQVERFPRELPVPQEEKEIEEMAYLGGQTLNQISRWEKEATALALARAGRPNCTLLLPEVTPFVLGQLFFFLEVMTVLAGGLFGVNPYDQPGVEELKRILYGLMGRAGYTRQAQGISPRIYRDNRFVL